MKGFHFPSTRTTNSVQIILDTQYSLCENYIKQARLHWGLKQVLDTNLIPLRTKFDTPTKRMPAWPVISQLWLPESHFSANGISLCLGEVQMKICKGWLQALLSPAPRGFAARSRVLARPVLLAQTGELASRLRYICTNLCTKNVGFYGFDTILCEKCEFCSLLKQIIVYFLLLVVKK